MGWHDTIAQPIRGERDISGGIPKAGDVNLRRALCQAATVMMHGRTFGMAEHLGRACRAPPWRGASVSSFTGCGSVGLTSDQATLCPMRSEEVSARPLPA